MGVYDAVLAILSPLIKSYALVGAAHRRPWRELLIIKVYLVLSILADLAEIIILQSYGIRSAAYRYTYYIADLCVVILGYFVLVRLLELAFDRTRLNLPNIRAVALLVFSGLAVISAAVVIRMRHALLRFSNEFEQNLSFLGMVLAIVLWIAMNLMLVPGLRFRRVVLAFSILYSSSAVLYTLEALFGSSAFSRALVPLIGIVTAGLFAYTLWTDDGEEQAPPLAPVSPVEEA